MDNADKVSLIPVPECQQCGTRFRKSVKGCPRGPACAAEAAEWERLTHLAGAQDRNSRR